MKIKFIISFSLLLLIMLGVFGCKSNTPVLPLQETNHYKTITEVVRDTVLVVEKDMSYYQAYIECINGQPVLKNEKTVSSNNGHLKPPKVKIEDNKLTADCELIAQELFLTWKEKYISEFKETKIPYPVIQPLTKWQIFQIWCGRIFLLIATASIFGLIYKLKK